ncbi:MAG: YebC/PmpR family DNA-binding transcriptional regulator [Candidatus Zophobacter franzmannii]|jgi:YebC/PmpR family DNA-binding regulatory protein|nr:YebC/PmpR family DNA-binding transcriptional regulator [Candidatus Zophobacter franzmannii]
MSGHNKWSSIKHKKGAADAKRGKVFTRIVKEIIVAAKQGGSDQETNASLRTAVGLAKQHNMPKDNIERAIKRGTGELDGVSYDHISYEGYGHNGVAVIVECLTDNKNRTVAEVRHCFSKYGGSLGENGAVSWNFDSKGYFTIPSAGLDEDEIMMEMLEAGAEDIVLLDDNFEIFTQTTNFHVCLRAVEKLGYTCENAELTKIPKSTINADDFAEKLMKLIDNLEDLDDVQKVYSNYEISDEVMERITAE